ncbi:MAG TPA: NAD(P)H-dependent oxidoreductase [Polyangia bacterium]
MKIFAFAASLRRESLNKKLVATVAGMLRELGGEVDLADFAEFDMPLFDGDKQHAEGLPPGTLRLQQRIEAASALVIASPEYNYSIGGPLKNAIDWVSRARPMPWRGRSIYLVAASPGPYGGIRGLWQTRIPLEGCGALVFPDMFGLPHADRAFAADGSLVDGAVADRLRQQVLGFYRLAEAVEPLCCGEATGAAATRQQEIVRALEDESRIQPPR